MAKKRSRKRRHPLHRLMKGSILVPVLFIVLVGFAVMLTSGTLVNRSATDPNEQFGEAEVGSESGKQNLQLKTLTFKPKPTPSDACTADSGKIVDKDCMCPDAQVICKGGKCIDINKAKSGWAFQNFTCASFGNYACINPPEDGPRCYGKPVIYLYPTTPTLVDVIVRTEGKIIVSDPLYPQGGWKQVLALPSGDLTYQNKHYNELFYETAVNTVSKPATGLVVATQDLKSDLRNFIQNLGLTRIDEQQEFLDWWIPRLTALHSPYIFVSLVDRDEKNHFDKVEISPKPDTFIDFIVYFKPLDKNETVVPLILPSTPRRIGFTVVEWGGVIDR
jgi:hypothetical protein